VTWLQTMFLWVVVGNYLGLFWPVLVKQFQKDYPPIEPRYAYGVPFPWKVVRLLLVGLVIAIASAALGFVAFLGDATKQREMEATGVLAYFSAFTYGFGAASFIEEPLKRKA
jgi:hypothetical protein